MFHLHSSDLKYALAIAVSTPHVHHDANAQEKIESVSCLLRLNLEFEDTNFYQILHRIGAPIRAELLVCILPENAADLYTAVKRAGDVIHGVPTQCVVSQLFEILSSDRRTKQC